MADDKSTFNEGHRILGAEIVRSGLDDKIKAIHDYEDIIWKIRSGYIVILYGALTFILGKEGVPDICAITRPFTKALALFSLVFGLSLSVFLIDFGYVRKRLKIVVARNKLIELACKKEFDIKSEEKEMQKLLDVAGETIPKELPDGLCGEYKKKEVLES